MIDTATHVLIFISAALAAVYAARLLLVRWWRTAIGRERMLTGVVFMIVLALAAMNAAGLNDYPGRRYVRFGCWVALTCVFGVKLWLLHVGQREGRERRHGPTDRRST